VKARLKSRTVFYTWLIRIQEITLKKYKPETINLSSFLFSGGFVFLANLLAVVALWLNGFLTQMYVDFL